MSYDFALEKRCPHETLFETATVDTSTGFVYFEKQPANSQSVSVYVNGELVPSTGFYSFAELASMKEEPYHITSGVNDLLYVSVGTDPPQFVQLLTGTAVKAKDVAQDLQKKLPGIQVTASGKRVTLRSRSRVNGISFSFPDPRWTDRSGSSQYTARALGGFGSLGLIPGRVVKGRRLFPGWTVVQDPRSPIETDVAIQFSDVIPNVHPTVHLCYTTVAQNCRRCFGSKIEFDYSVSDGGYEIVSNTDLLTQEFDKFLFTRLGSHWKWTWIGSGLIDMIGGKSNGTKASAQALITMDVSQAFKVYQNIKQQQEQRFPFQRVSDSEMPYALESVNSQVLPDDPTTAIVSISVRSRSRNPVPLTRVVGNPNPFTLIGGGGGPPLLPRG